MIQQIFQNVAKAIRKVSMALTRIRERRALPGPGG